MKITVVLISLFLSIGLSQHAISQKVGYIRLSYYDYGKPYPSTIFYLGESAESFFATLYNHNTISVTENELDSIYKIIVTGKFDSVSNGIILLEGNKYPDTETIQMNKVDSGITLLPAPFHFVICYEGSETSVLSYNPNILSDIFDCIVHQFNEPGKQKMVKELLKEFKSRF